MSAFKKQSDIYKQYTQFATTLIQNTFDDDLVEDAMLKLASLFQASLFAKLLAVNDT